MKFLNPQFRADDSFEVGQSIHVRQWQHLTTTTKTEMSKSDIDFFPIQDPTHFSLGKAIEPFPSELIQAWLDLAGQ